MQSGVWFLSILYVLIIFGVTGIVLHLGFRFVRAVENIAEIYVKKNG